VSSGTKPLRFILLLGVFSVIMSAVIGAYAVWQKLAMKIPVQGWTSLIIVITFFLGCILFSLGIIAEYIGTVLNMAIGRPLYLAISQPIRKRKQQ
jgi:undecaprenyl-phosphate 4-deoxy-4-formamido-L-arabinose transferase